MLHLNEASDIRPLVRALSDLLAEPLADPMSAEWVAVPSLGMQRWTKLELARSLGSSQGREDGIAANISFNFPGKLRQLVFEAAGRERSGDDNDPWQIDQLVWTIFEILEIDARDREIHNMPGLPVGASSYGRARRIADLFDRYALHRPELIEEWRAGRNIDANGHALTKELSWQPELWRRAREHIGEPSPPEHVRALLDRVRTGELDLELPPRLSIFGITSLPGGWGFLDLIEALASKRDVHCFFLEPSPVVARRIGGKASQEQGTTSLLRSQDCSQNLLHHPLLLSWGSPFRERAALFAVARRNREFSHFKNVDTQYLRSDVRGQPSLLARVQEDLRADRPPDGTFELRPEDGSIEVHACYGPARQVEVLRDAIMHLLQDDPDLEEEEIVVLCPRITDFAPFIEAGFGQSSTALAPSAGEPREAPTGDASRFTYHMSDRSLRSPNGLLEAFDAFLALVGGRCSASEMLEFFALDPVRRRFGFNDNALERVNTWVRDTNVRWGLSAEHRIDMGFSERYELNTWRAAVDSLLIGVTTHDLENGLALGGIAPFGVEGEEIEIAGQLGDLLDRLEDVAEQFRLPRSPRRWCEVLARSISALFALDPAESWQFDGLHRLLEQISASLVYKGREHTVEVSFADMRRVLADGLRGAPGRADFFRGGVTVSSLTPLRWIPFKVVCLLGLDDSPSKDADVNGDDVMALAPQLGDPDERSESRQSILEAVLAAQQRLIVTVSAFDPRTNLATPRSVEFLELKDTVVQTLAPASQDLWIQGREIFHPRQSYDERNFEPGRLGRKGPWSFDSTALLGARARRTQDLGPKLLIEQPLQFHGDESGFTIEELREFLLHPVRSFLKKSLQIYRPYERDETSDELPVALEPRERAAIGRRLLETRMRQPDRARWQTDSVQWWERERARGALPVGHFADVLRDDIEREVNEIIDGLHGFDIDPMSPDGPTVPIDRALGTGKAARRVYGTLTPGEFVASSGSYWCGTWNARFSHLRPVDALSPWLDLLLLTLERPVVIWRSVLLRRPATGSSGPQIVDLRLVGETKDARQNAAKSGMRAVLELAKLGRSEPLPLFVNLSRAMHLGDVEEADWRGGGHNTYSDGLDRDNVLAFGQIRLDELSRIPARDSDPGTGPFRAARLAHYLWGTFEKTVVEGMPQPKPQDAKRFGRFDG
ncbi:MAG TPA: exodeoxyribonuclease V subunit gamma [Acidimicrobiales bacterium]|nr:exodeoxyribonuclease V subunit gamma [Acidimicrobiales bacterium]